MSRIDEIKAAIDNGGYTVELAHELIDEITNGIPHNRLEAICAAERDGRLVVLPCKVGNPAYAIRKGKIKEYPDTDFLIWRDSSGSVCIEMRAQISAMAKEHIDGLLGRTWFLTRPEAQVALAAAKQPQ